MVVPDANFHSEKRTSYVSRFSMQSNTIEMHVVRKIPLPNVGTTSLFRRAWDAVGGAIVIVYHYLTEIQREVS